MSYFPKVGTLEATVLAKLLALKGEDGICYMDFPENSELHDPQKLEQIISNLNNGMYEAEEDNLIKLDS
jgi:hypothetical protein